MKKYILALIALATLATACKKEACKTCQIKHGINYQDTVAHTYNICSGDFKFYAGANYYIIQGTDTFADCR